MSLKSKSKSQIIIPRPGRNKANLFNEAQAESMRAKSKDYVTSLFADGGKNPWSEFPDDFDPQDTIVSDADFDLTQLMDGAIDSVTGLPRDIRLPEGDFKEAKNYFDWCANFQGQDSKFPFARQMWAVIYLMGEFCPRCSNPKWKKIKNIAVDASPLNIPNNVMMLEYGVCPCCKATKHELIKSGELADYTEAAWMWGQRSGKSMLTSTIATYILHKYLKFPKMSVVCEGIQASTPLTATFVALRFADAMALLWDPISKSIKANPWFTAFHAMLDDYGQRLGLELYRFKDIYLRYEHKNLELYPAGPNKRALRGRTRFLTAIDELGWFPVGEENRDLERGDADEVHTSLDRSLLTIRREVRQLYRKGYNSFLQGIAINISSPSDETDKICRLVEENRKSTKVLAIQMATWNINPLYTKDNEEIAEAYRKNPITAERDYGAKPPMNAKSFIDMTLAAKAFTGINRVVIERISNEINGKKRIAARLVSAVAEQPQSASLMSLDAGLTNNAFAITIQTVQETVQGETKSLKVKVPVMLEIQPRPGASLHFSKIYELVIKPLLKTFNVRYLFADRWNSVALLDMAEEDFKSVNLISKQHSVKYPDFMLTRSYIEEGKLILPKTEMEFDQIRLIDSYPSYFALKPASHLLFQFGTVRDMGNTVIKGGPYTDDLFRALVLGVGRILDPKILPEILKMSNTIHIRNVGAIASGRMMGIQGVGPLMRNSQQGSNVGSSTVMIGHSYGVRSVGGMGSGNVGTSNVVRSNRTSY
jgi:hypothetical protein